MRCRVLDALLPCVHPGGIRSFSDDPGFEFVHGDLRDAQTVDDALRGVSAVCHLAAMVGLGVDFGDAPLYAGCNDLGTAVLLAAMARAGVRRLVLASSMVVYGEGAYSCAEHGLAATPPPRHAADLDAGRFEPRCERCGETADIGAGARGCTARAAQRLRGDQGRAGTPHRFLGQGDSGSGGGAALSQRVRPGDAARHAVRRGGVVLPLCPGGWPRAAGLRGRSAATGLRPRPRRRRRHRRRDSTCVTRPRLSPAGQAPCAPTTSAAAPRAPWASWRQRWPTPTAAQTR